jgi:hypothetical protein
VLHALLLRRASRVAPLLRVLRLPALIVPLLWLNMLLPLLGVLWLVMTLLCTL